MIKYEDLAKKNQISGPWLPKVNGLINAMSDLYADADSPFYQNEQFRKYASAISTIKQYSKSARKKKEVENALETLKDFAEFLEKEGLPGKSNYQLLVDHAENHDYKKSEVNDSLTIISNFVEMGIKVDVLQKKQAELDEKNAALKDDGSPLSDIELFDMRTNSKMTFASTEGSRNTVNGFVGVLSDAINALNDKIEAKEKKEAGKFSIKEEEQKAYEENVALRDKLNAYVEDIKALNTPKSDGLYTKAMRTNALNNLKDFQAFLNDGLEKTNLTRILEEAATENTKATKNELETKVKNGMQALEGTLHFGLDAEKAKEVTEANKKRLAEIKKQQAELEHKKTNKNSSYQWIEGWKQKFQNDKSLLTLNPETGKKLITYIMASRELAQTGRNQPSILQKSQQSQFDLEQKVAEMFEKDGPLKDFIGELSKDPKLAAKAAKAAASGHGGGLDDMFTDYLKNLPPGKLPNDPSLARYMPTVKDRIEALQKQAKQTIKNAKDPVAETAEIVVLRNMIKAERGVKSSLEYKIPMGKRNLQDEVTKMANRESFKEIVSNPKVQSLIKEGHGGKMLMEMRTAYHSTKGRADSSETQKILNEGTIATRLSTIREEAKELKTRLDQLVAADKKGKASSEDFSDIYKEAKSLIAEDIALSQYYTKNPVKDGENIPWRKINKMRDEILRDVTMTNALYPTSSYNANDIGNRLKDLSDADTNLGFYQKLKGDVTRVMNENKIAPAPKEAVENIKAPAPKGNEHGPNEEAPMNEAEFMKNMELMGKIHDQINNTTVNNKQPKPTAKPRSFG